MKVNRLKYNLKRYVFSGRYFVRNALFVMILLTVVSIGIVGASLLNSDDKKEVEETVETTKTAVPVLKVEAPSMIAGISHDELAEIIKNEQNVEVSAKESVVLAQTKVDMTGKFIAIEDAINIRNSADAEGEIIGRLYKGGFGEVIAENQGWTMIRSGKVTGYVASQYIATDLAAAEVAEDLKGAIATATEKNVCVREDSSEDADILYLAAEGENFIVNKDRNENGWYSVRLDDGTYGFMSADFVEVEDGYSEAVSAKRIDEVKAAKAQLAEKVAAEKEAEEQRKAEAEKEEARREEIERQEAAAKEEKAEEKKEEKVEEKQEEKQEEKKEEKKEEKQEEKKEEKSEETKSTTEEPVQAETSDLYLLAAIIYCEAGVEPYEGKLAVANVVLNRLRSGKYGATLSDVIYAPYQFTGCQMYSFPTALKTGGTPDCLRAAQEALNGNNNVPGYLYFRPYKNVALEKLHDYKIIGTHVYYKN